MALTNEQKKQYEEHLQILRSRLPEFLQFHELPLDRNFICVNPRHVHNKYTGSMSYDKEHNKVHCFGNCETNPNFDIFDMAGFLGHCNSFGEKVRYVEEILGVDPVSFKARKICFLNGNHNFLIRDGLIPETDDKGKPFEDYTGMINAGLYNIKQAGDYLVSRGIRRDLAAEFSIGFLPKFNFLGVDGSALVIPGSKLYVSVRDTTGAFVDRYLKFGSGDLAGLFNPDAILDACASCRPVFVTEGELDALSVITAGGLAVALRGKAYSGFLQALDLAVKKTGKYPVVVLACDNDTTGMEVNRSLYTDLKNKEVIVYFIDAVYCGYKDMNDALVHAKERYVGFINDTQSEEGLKKLNYYQNMCALSTARKIADHKVDTTCISTGIPSLDKALGGGLYPCIHVLGAMPATGKSTLAVQIAENVALAGHDVLYFGMEMSKEAIVSRSLSKLTFIVSVASFHGSYEHAMDSRHVLYYDRRLAYEKYSNMPDCKEKKKLFNDLKVFDDANKMYTNYGYRMIPISGIFSGDDVIKMVENHLKATGVVPAVFVDYLQIMGNPRALGDKQAVDANIKGLVPVVAKYKMPLVIISSLNRVGYDTMNMTAYSSSSGIESYAEVLMMLTYERAGQEGFCVDVEKHLFPRKMKIAFLKNRYGDDSATVLLDYYAKYNYFTDHKMVECAKTFEVGDVAQRVDMNNSDLDIVVVK